MKRVALITAIIAVLLLIDGSYLQLSNNEVGGDSGVLFGNPHLVLSAGTVVLISGGLMLVGAAVMWLAVRFRKDRLAGQGDQAGQPQASATQATVAAGQARAGEGPGHQSQP